MSSTDQDLPTPLPPHRIDGFAVRQVGTVDLSWDGRLMVGDPFRDFTKRGNPYIHLPSGQWPVMATLDTQGDEARLVCLSVVFDTALIEMRRRWQARIMQRGGGLALPGDILTPYTQDGDEPMEWECLTGHGALVPKQAFEDGMPPPMPDMGWFEMLFEPGRDGSWFDQVDSAHEQGLDVAAIHLPLNQYPLLAFSCPAGMRAWMEWATIPGDGLEGRGELDPIEQEVIIRTNPLAAFHIHILPR